MIRVVAGVIAVAVAGAIAVAGVMLASAIVASIGANIIADLE